MIDLDKSLTAKIYDFDQLWDIPDGEDDRGKFIIRTVETIMLPHLPYTMQPEIICVGGSRSVTFDILPQN